MNVLHIDTEKTWRGGENQMRLLIEGLKGSGVFCHAALNPDSEALKRLHGLTNILPVTMRGGFDLSAAFKIIKYCKKNKIDLIDTQTSNAHSLALLVKLFLPQIKLVVHRRVDFPLKTKWINQKKYKSNKVDHYVAISKAIGKILVNYGLSNDKVSVVPSAVSSEPYLNLTHSVEKENLCKALNLDSSIPLIGNASALTDQKGYEVLLNAIAILKERSLRFNCVIAGDGHLRDKLEKMRIDLKIDNQISFLGWIKEVPSFLTALDFLTMPSNFEGLGTLILDATYADCLVITTDAGGIPEMITHKETGLVSAVGNELQLADNIEYALKNIGEMEKYKKAAREHIEKDFSLDQMVHGNLAIYKKLIK